MGALEGGVKLLKEFRERSKVWMENDVTVVSTEKAAVRKVGRNEVPMS